MFACLFAVLALAAVQPAQDDGPVRTAGREIAADAAQEVPPPKGSKPVAEDKTAPAAVAAAKTLTFEPKTKVDGDTLQIVLGQRALFRVDDKGRPVLAKVEEGQLAAAHPAGKAKESFEPPPDGQIAVALDGSAEVQASVLKVWNRTDKVFDYRAIALVMRQGKLAALPTPALCAVGPRSVRTETWRRPIVAVGLGRFKQSVTTKACQ
jgi:hypothetical protein